MRQIAVMLDSGAQRSVITKNAVQSMKFPIVGTEKVALQGFNERSPRSLTYNVAQIQLGKPPNGSKSITIDALVVADINKLMMVGAAAFAKKLAKKGHTLADHRFLNTKSDEISIDMLVGNEHRHKIISPKLPSIQLYGMFCPRTVYGGIVMSGTIPGPASISSKISNNIVTIFNFSCLESAPSKPEDVPEPDELKTANLPNIIQHQATQINKTKRLRLGKSSRFIKIFL